MGFGSLLYLDAKARQNDSPKLLKLEQTAIIPYTFGVQVATFHLQAGHWVTQAQDDCFARYELESKLLKGGYIEDYMGEHYRDQ